MAIELTAKEKFERIKQLEAASEYADECFVKQILHHIGFRCPAKQPNPDEAYFSYKVWDEHGRIIEEVPHYRLCLNVNRQPWIQIREFLNRTYTQVS